MELVVLEHSPGMIYTYWKGFQNYFIGYDPISISQYLENKLDCQVFYIPEEDSLRIDKPVSIEELYKYMGY